MFLNQSKHRKQFKGRIHGHAKGNHELSFGFMVLNHYNQKEFL